MNKYTLLRFNKCYMNRDGSCVVAVLEGNRKNGYTMTGSYAHKWVWIWRFHLETRAVLNDGNWREISPALYSAATAIHRGGYRIDLPADYEDGKIPRIVKMR